MALDRDTLKQITYTLLQLVPEGRVVSYKELAGIVGVHPRTIAWFMRENREPIIIPCHRVVGSNGDLGGYSYGGKRVKEWLLRLEGVGIVDGKIPREYYYPLKKHLLEDP